MKNYNTRLYVQMYRWGEKKRDFRDDIEGGRGLVHDSVRLDVTCLFGIDIFEKKNKIKRRGISVEVEISWKNTNRKNP